MTTTYFRINHSPEVREGPPHPLFLPFERVLDEMEQRVHTMDRMPQAPYVGRSLDDFAAEEQSLPPDLPDMLWVRYYFLLGRLYMQANMYALAQKMFAIAAQRMPPSPGAKERLSIFRWRGLAHDRLDEFEAAALDMANLIREAEQAHHTGTLDVIGGNQAFLCNCYSNYGAVRGSQAEYDIALLAFQEALQILDGLQHMYLLGGLTDPQECTNFERDLRVNLPLRFAQVTCFAMHEAHDEEINMNAMNLMDAQRRLEEVMVLPEVINDIGLNFGVQTAYANVCLVMSEVYRPAAFREQFLRLAEKHLANARQSLQQLPTITEPKTPYDFFGVAMRHFLELEDQRLAFYRIRNRNELENCAGIESSLHLLGMTVEKEFAYNDSSLPSVAVQLWLLRGQVAKFQWRKNYPNRDFHYNDAYFAYTKAIELIDGITPRRVLTHYVRLAHLGLDLLG